LVKPLNLIAIFKESEYDAEYLRPQPT
jgi:hypothetical protein